MPEDGSEVANAGAKRYHYVSRTGRWVSDAFA